MEPKIQRILHIYEDMAEENKDTIVDEDFDKYSVGETMLLIYHQHSGVWGEHLQSTLHNHNFYEIEFVYGGKGIHLLGNSSFQMTKGGTYLRTPNNLHTTWQDKEDVIQSYKIQFTGDFIPKEMLSPLLVESHALRVQFSPEELAGIIERIGRIRREMKEQKPYYTVVMTNLFQELLVMFIRKYQDVQKEPSPYSSHVTETLRYINDNFRGEICVRELAERLHLTAHYLGDLFR